MSGKRQSDAGGSLAWIFGSSRSGSTWLLRMLADDAAVVPLDDPHLGHHLGVWRPLSLAWGASEEPPPLRTLAELKAEQDGYFFAARHRERWAPPLRELIRARLEAQAEERLGAAAAAGAHTYVVKEPGSQVAPLLAELFPASRLVFLLRDGRDVVDSWLAAYQHGSWAIEGGAFPVAEAGRIPLIRWLASVWAYRTRAVRRAFEAHDPERRILVRYEDLRERTAATLAEVCATIGLAGFDAAASAARHRFERVPAGERGPRREIRAARPGGWRENLTPAEQAALHEVLGEELAELGYTVELRAAS
jgi:hypothetical protein